MPLILRIINKNNWRGREEFPWLTKDPLQTDAIQADAMHDLRTTENTISVYEVNDDKSNLEQIISGYTAGRHKPAHFDYALFDQQLLLKSDIKIEAFAGSTPSTEANACHRHLSELSVHKLTELAKIIMGKAERERLQKKHILRLIKQATDSVDIDRSKIDSRILREIAKL
ncbi:hypothetical protein ES703_14961 [subsurface metagenome]